MHVPLGDTYYVKFTTRSFSTGAPATLSGTPAISVYEEANLTQITSGVTLTVDYDSVTGLNDVAIVASGANGYEAGKYYSVVITTGTVGGVSVVGEVVGHFRIMEAEVTAGRPTALTSAIANDAITAAAIAADAIGSSELATTAVDEIVDAVWDEVLTGGTHNVTNSAGRRLRALQDFAGYALGAIWIDTVNGTAGTTDFENGTVNNPVDTLADALTLSASLSINRFMVAAGSSITLAAAATNYEFMGQNWTLAFGGQSIAGAKINGATVSGTFAGTTAILEDCIINAITGPGITMRRCFYNEVTVTANGAGSWFLNDLRSRIVGTGRMTFDFGVGVLNTDLSIRNISGGVELQNMGDAGTDTASIEGNGNVVLNANCDGGTLVMRGNFDHTDNSGSVTVVQTARPAYQFGLIQGSTFDTSTDSLEAIRNRGDAAWITGAGGSPPQLLQSTTIATLASQTSFTLTAGSADDDAYNGAIAVITDQSTSTQKAVGSVDDYVGSTRTVTLAADPAIFTMAVGDTIEIIAALGAAGSGPTAGQIADAVWDEAQSGHVTAGSFGEIATEVASILADTNELQTDDVPGLIAALNDIAATDIVSNGAITTLAGAVVNVDTVDTCTTNTDMRGTDNALLAASAPTNFGDLAITATTGRVDINANNDKTGYSISGTLTTLDALDTAQDAQHAQTQSDIAALNDLSAAQVNAEVVDALATDTYAEPGQGTPGATISLAAKVNYLYKAWRNRSTQSATQYSLYADDATTVDQKATVSDDGTTADKGEIATGP